VLLHERRPFANLRIAVPAQIGKNQPVARFERRSHRIPEFVIGRKRMEQNDGRPVPANFIKISASSLRRRSMERDYIVETLQQVKWSAGRPRPAIRLPSTV
jgi:hypothetical protein